MHSRLLEDIVYSELLALACLKSNMIDAGMTFAIPRWN